MLIQENSTKKRQILNIETCNYLSFLDYHNIKNVSAVPNIISGLVKSFGNNSISSSAGLVSN